MLIGTGRGELGILTAALVESYQPLPHYFLSALMCLYCIRQALHAEFWYESTVLLATYARLTTPELVSTGTTSHSLAAATVEAQCRYDPSV